MDALRDHPEVLYGAIAALRDRDPADARGRRDGAAPRRRRPPGEPAAERQSDPAARRPRDLLRDLRAGARVPRARPRDARRPARRRGRDGRRRDRRLPRPQAGARSWRARSSPPRSRPSSASGSTTSRSRSSARVDLPAVVGMPLTVLWIVAVMNMVNFLDGMDGLAAGRLRDRRHHVRVLALSLGEDRPGHPLGDRRRRVHRLPAPQLLPGADLHGRLGRARCSGSCSPPSRCRGC